VKWEQKSFTPTGVKLILLLALKRFALDVYIKKSVLNGDFTMSISEYGVASLRTSVAVCVRY
jgi:hypothetical protein